LGKVIKVVLALCLLFAGMMSLGGCSLLGIRSLMSINQIDRAIYPEDFDMALARQKGLDTVSSYKQVQDNYFVLFSTYLCSLYDFSAADAYLDSEGFEPVEKGDYYYNRSLLGSKYFYLRNNVHVERLSGEQIIYLKNDTLAADDPEGMQIVKDTYKDVLAIHYTWPEDGEYDTTYQRYGGDHSTPNTAIVFYVEYKDRWMGSDNYFAHLREDAGVIRDLSSGIKMELQPSFEVGIVFYNPVLLGDTDKFFGSEIDPEVTP